MIVIDVVYTCLSLGTLFISYSVSLFVFFFFNQNTAYEIRISDCSSDVCSSDLLAGINPPADTQIKSASTQVRVDPAGVKLDDILAIITGIGQVTGSGTIDAKQNLDFNLRIAPDATLAASGDTTNSGSVALALQGALGTRSEEHTSELQSLMRISYAVFC